jgi:carbonic anhydrase
MADVSRRALIAGIGVGAVASIIAKAIAAAPIDLASRAASTPDAALRLLEAGNAAFLNGTLPAIDMGPRRRLQLASGQAPFCAYVSCSDSRVPPELLFGRGLGELFIIRNAGNTVDTVAMGSIEYAVLELGVPLVVVMGHESCGAVKAAMAVVEKNAGFPGAIGSMIEPIIPAVLQARGQAGDPVENAVRQNVRRVVDVMRHESDPILLKPQQEGKLRIIGAYYELATGRVDFFDKG